MRWAPILFLVACWHSNDPARWQPPTPTRGLLPSGAWFIAEVDVAPDHLSKPKPIANADKTCSFPTDHASFAVYAGNKLAFAGRGVLPPETMLDCLASSDENHRGRFAGRDVVFAKDMIYVATSSRLLFGAEEPLMRQILAADFRAAADDPMLAPLIARARDGAELWAAARLPADAEIIDDVLEVLGVKLAGRPKTIIASVHFTDPYQIKVEIELASAADATALAHALENKQQEYAKLDPTLAVILGALAVTSDGVYVRVIGHPPTLDWMQALQSLLNLIKSKV